MENLLNVQGLQKKIGSFQLKDISFTLPKGYIMGYVGQNGAGKTTTIKLITRLFKPDAGHIDVDGLTCEESPAAYKEAIGLIGDVSYFPVNFNTKMLAATLKDFYPTFDAVKFQELCRRWDVPENKKVQEFSRGMRVKLMFAGVLARQTKVLILDEATNGLDPVIRNEVLDILQEYIADGEHSILFSSHIMEDLERIADFIYFIDDGREILNGAKDDILEEFLLVKGGPEEMTSRLEARFIGMTRSAVGFEGLLKADDASLIVPGMVVERPTIDNIVIYHIQKMRRK